MLDAWDWEWCHDQLPVRIAAGHSFPRALTSSILAMKGTLLLEHHGTPGRATTPVAPQENAFGSLGQSAAVAVQLGILPRDFSLSDSLGRGYPFHIL